MEMGVLSHLSLLRQPLRIMRSTRHLLVGLYLWLFYDGGSRENVTAPGVNPVHKNCSFTTTNHHD